MSEFEIRWRHPRSIRVPTDNIDTKLMRCLSLCLIAAMALTELVGKSHAADTLTPARPNIIFIMADDLGYADVGAFGSELISTPNIDRLAREGALFTQFYAGGPVCAPSREVLMTGRHMGHAMLRSNSPKVGGEEEAFGEGTRRISMTGKETTIAALLRDSGYVTGITGKWGIGEPGSGATPTEMAAGLRSFHKLANWRISSAESPQISAARSGVYLAAASRNCSAPRTCRSIKPWSSPPWRCNSAATA